MAEQKIIAKTDIIEFWPASVNISDSKFNASILRAQQTDLEPLLGYYLYNAFIEDFNGTDFDTPIYQTLFDGGSYTYQNNNRYFRGVRNLLAVYSYARLVDLAEIQLTNTGLVDKETEESTQREDYQVRHVRRISKDDAIRLEKDTIDFIEANKADYPLYWKVYSSDNKPIKTSYNFFKV